MALLGHIATVTLDIIVSSDAVVAFVILLVALLIPLSMKFQYSAKSTFHHACMLFV